MQATLGERLESAGHCPRNTAPDIRASIVQQAFKEETFFALETLLLSRLPPHARILDICCGRGRLSEFLVRCGFRVTCVDGCPRMIEASKKRVRAARFLCGDIRQLALPRDFEAVVCSTQPGAIWRADELVTVFGAAYHSLVRGGFFCFEMRTRDAFRNAGSGLFATGSQIAQPATVNVTSFYPGGTQANLSFKQLCYDAKEIELALNIAGFRETHCYHAEDLGIRRDCAAGRLFFLGCKRFSLSQPNAVPIADAA